MRATKAKPIILPLMLPQLDLEMEDMAALS